MRAGLSAIGMLVCAATAVVPAGCDICGPDHRSVLSYADNGLTVARGTAAPVATTLNSSLYDREADAQSFQSTWDVFAHGSQPYTGVAVTATGGSDRQLVGLVLALPTPVRDGQHVNVSGAFPPPAEPYVMYWSVWGEHPLSDRSAAQIALRVSDFSPTGGPSNPFVATTASGTIDVTETESDTFRLVLDITATGAAGETIRLRGPLVLRLQREPSTCFS